MQHAINLFMWAYQSHYRWNLEYRTKRVFELLGSETEPKAILVGLIRPGSPEGHPICVEPEGGDWDLSLFRSLIDDVARAIPSHPLQRMYYGDERSMREKPERIRQLILGEEVRRALDAEGRKSDRRTFCSPAYPVGNYDVVCALQLPESLFRQYPSFAVTWREETYEAGLVQSCISTILDEAQRGLALPEPGRLISDAGMRSAEEIILLSAASLMRTSFIPGRFCTFDMFEAVNRLSQMRYEGRVGAGRLVLAAADDPNIDYVLRLTKLARLTEPRWARKLLQMATADVALICEYGEIAGLGGCPTLALLRFQLSFSTTISGSFSRGEQVLLRCSFGRVRLPQEVIGKDRFADNMRRVFTGIQEPAIARFRIVLDLLTQLRNGSSLVIARDAANEAKRLARQATLIVPTRLTKELIERGSAIDGTILADEDGVCHAIGVILDGQASDESTPSRGARFNSAVRYVMDAPAARMAFVISEDRTLDIVPLLRPRVQSRQIEAAVAKLADATIDNYHECRSFLDEHRFYVNDDQCRIVNEALDRIESEPTELGRIVLLTQRFEPHPAFNASYLKAD